MAGSHKITPLAAALKYESMRDKAPRVIARGRGYQAKRLLAKARENDIPVIENKDLIKILMQINETDPVPEIVYQAVAEIYLFIRRLEEISG